MKLNLLIFATAIIIAPLSVFGQTSDLCKVDAAQKQKARAVIQKVIQASIDRRTHHFSNGNASLLGSPAPTDEEIEKVRAFGDTAVCILAQYATDNPSVAHYNLRQWAALVLLTSFKSDNALAAMVQFAEHSRPRGYAVQYMCAFPIEKTRPFLDKFAKDPEYGVREAATECLNRLAD